jgi:hypothetical protein
LYRKSRIMASKVPANTRCFSYRASSYSYANLSGTPFTQN